VRPQVPEADAVEVHFVADVVWLECLLLVDVVLVFRDQYGLDLDRGSRLLSSDEVFEFVYLRPVFLVGQESVWIRLARLHILAVPFFVQLEQLFLFFLSQSLLVHGQLFDSGFGFGEEFLDFQLLVVIVQVDLQRAEDVVTEQVIVPDFDEKRFGHSV